MYRSSSPSDTNNSKHKHCSIQGNTNHNTAHQIAAPSDIVQTHALILTIFVTIIDNKAELCQYLH